MRTSFHWREYGLEAAGTAVLLATVATAATSLHVIDWTIFGSAIGAWAPRVVMGCIMGSTVLLLATSPWGRRSGAHYNPAVTIGFLRTHRIAPHDAAAYIVAQITGAASGLFTAIIVISTIIRPRPVPSVITAPGDTGEAVAFAVELVISFALMSAILFALAHHRFAAHTARIAAASVAIFISLAEPYSGASMNPARSLASGINSWHWDALWIYLAAPTAGMLAAAELRRARLRRGRSATDRSGTRTDGCAKLVHDPLYDCIFCGHRAPADSPAAVPAIAERA